MFYVKLDSAYIEMQKGFHSSCLWTEDFLKAALLDELLKNVLLTQKQSPLTYQFTSFKCN